MQPEADFPPTHSSGVREKASRKWTLFENERITEFFGAAGNLHMILFEILFKHHYIMIPPHLVELGTGGNLIQMKYMRFYFFKFVKMLTKKFARLEVLDNGQFKLEPSSKSEDVHMAKNLEKGIYHIRYIQQMQMCFQMPSLLYFLLRFLFQHHGLEQRVPN